MRSICVTTVVVREHVCGCVHTCSLAYPACDAHAPYCHLLCLWHHHIFPHYLINGTVFEKTLSNIKYMF